MRHQKISPDHFTFPFVLKACARLQTKLGLHLLFLKLGFDSDIYVQNGLISFYGCLGSVEIAVKVFEDMTVRDLVSWSSMIGCFTDNGLGYEALALFQRMQLEANVKPDEFMMLSVISAISNLGAVESGRWIDVFIRRSGLKHSVSLGTALIDMYSRCGSVDDSIGVFDEMPIRNVSTWMALITGLTVHGRSSEALRAFLEMKKCGLQPDHITFIGVLVACSHGGLVEEGWQVFNSIKNEYGMEPTLEQYGCMVDLLGRAGSISEAVKFIKRMPIKPNVVVWRTLFGACVSHNNVELAEKVKDRIHELDPHHDGD